MVYATARTSVRKWHEAPVNSYLTGASPILIVGCARATGAGRCMRARACRSAGRCPSTGSLGHISAANRLSGTSRHAQGLSDALERIHNGLHALAQPALVAVCALSLSKRGPVPFDRLRAHQRQAQGTSATGSGHINNGLRAQSRACTPFDSAAVWQCGDVGGRQ